MLTENEFVQQIEDDFDCSGLCRPALFYMTRSIEQGKPKKTCMKVLTTVISEAASPFGNSCVIAAVAGLISWILHFGLYCRPQEASTDALEPGM